MDLFGSIVEELLEHGLHSRDLCRVSHKHQVMYVLLLATSASQALFTRPMGLPSSPCKLLEACPRQRERVDGALEKRLNLNGGLQPTQSLLHCSLALPCRHSRTYPSASSFRLLRMLKQHSHTVPGFDLGLVGLAFSTAPLCPLHLRSISACGNRPFSLVMMI